MLGSAQLKGASRDPGLGRRWWKRLTFDLCDLEPDQQVKDKDLTRYLSAS